MFSQYHQKISFPSNLHSPDDQAKHMLYHQARPPGTKQVFFIDGDCKVPQDAVI